VTAPVPGEVALARLDATARAARTALAALAAGDEGQAQEAANRAAGHARRAADGIAAWRAALTLCEVADFAQVHEDDVRAAVVTGRLTVVAVGPHRRVTADDALMFAEAQERRRKNAANRKRERERARAAEATR